MPFPPLLNKVNSENNVSSLSGGVPPSPIIFLFFILFFFKIQSQKKPCRCVGKVSGKFLLFLTLTRCKPTIRVLRSKQFKRSEYYQNCNFWRFEHCEDCIGVFLIFSLLKDFFNQ